MQLISACLKIYGEVDEKITNGEHEKGGNDTNAVEVDCFITQKFE